MLKKFFISLIVVILLGVGAFFYFLSEKRIVIKPYPYIVMDYKVDNIAEAEKANVLIIGDRMGKALDKEIKELETATNLSIYNWSQPKEGLHRTLYKLNQLKKFPSIIVYQGASEELFEKKFSVKDKEKIEKNFKTYADDKIISLIITFPILSKYFYQDLNYVEIAPLNENKEIYSPNDKLNRKVISFQIFNEELKDLIEIAHLHKVKLIFISTPLNYSAAPKEICAHSSTPTTQEMQTKIEAMIKEGAFKEAYPLALQLSKVSTSNAQSFYLLGLAARGVGDQNIARMALKKANVFDCANWRGNSVYNSILAKEAKRNQIPFIDFDLVINSGENTDAIFFDEIFPQNIFYQSLAKELGETIKLIYSAIK